MHTGGVTILLVIEECDPGREGYIRLVYLLAGREYHWVIIMIQP